jgi:hypothetical protein
MYQAETYHLPIRLVGEDEQGYIDVRIPDSIPDRRGWAGEYYALHFPEDIDGIPEKASSNAVDAVMFDHSSTDV